MLYVASATGILRVDTATAEPTRLPQPDSAMTGGIDGLYWHEGDLIGVQNVTNPGRVIRIGLDLELADRPAAQDLRRSSEKWRARRPHQGSANDNRAIASRARRALAAPQ